MHLHSQVESFALLAMISIAYFLAVHRVERLRLAAAKRELPNMANPMVFAGAVLLPPLMIILLAGVFYLAEWWWVVRHVSQKLYKHAYAGGVLGCSGLAAWAVLHSAAGPVGDVLAVAAYHATDTALMAGAITAAREYAALRMFASVRGHVMEAGSAAGGLAIAEAMGIYPLLALLAVPALVGLHQVDLRAVMRRPLFDPGSQLWSERAWRPRARLMLSKTRFGRILLVIIDPHCEECRASIRRNLGPAVQEQDPVGRYGSRQVVLALKLGPGEPGLYVSAIRANLAASGMVVMLGYAVSEGPATDLESLLLCAGQNLMATRAAAQVSSRG